MQLKMDQSAEEARAIRQYRKSLLPRLRWTPELHRHFVQAVHSLGGKNKATPKKIMQIMGVKGLKISHVKSHLQMYRSMRESMISNEFISIKNYQDKRSNSRQIYPRLGEAASHGKLVRVPFTCQVRRITQKDKIVIYHQNQGQGAEGKIGSEATKGSAEEPGAKLEVQGISEINFLGLGNNNNNNNNNNQSSEESINLDLTISSH